MGCTGDREKGDIEESQKWEYVTLSDFQASGALAYLSYAWLWALALIAVAVYAADTFTAINLLAYDKWSSQIEPTISLKYSKWIFAVCIIISWALCIFEWVRAIRVIRRGGIAESYMDSLAVTLQSMRPQGWRRFLVFAELTKSKKGLDYIALFVYFAFKGAIRIILAEAPRQVVNAITLYSFMQSDLIPTNDQTSSEKRSSFDQFWVNVETLAESNREQAVVLFTMLFTLVIWVISALCLIIAVILYLFFLWHYIPQRDGRLSIYCRRKIDRRLERIVGEKVKKALEDTEKKRLREEAKAAKTDGNLPTRPHTKRQPTLPQMATPPVGHGSEFGLVNQDARTALQTQAQRPPPVRSDTAPMAPIQRHPTLPELDKPGDRQAMGLTRNYTAPSALQRQRGFDGAENVPNMPPPSRTRTAPPMNMQRQPTLPYIDVAGRRPSMPYHSDTEASALSNATYASDAPLLGHANEMGFSEDSVHVPAQPQPVLDRQFSYTARPLPSRNLTGGSAQSVQRPRYNSRDESWQHPRELTSPVDVEQHDGRLGRAINHQWQQQQRQPAVTSAVEHRDPYGFPYGMPPHHDPEEREYPETISPQRQILHSTFQRPFTPVSRAGSSLNFSTRQAPEQESQSFEMTSQSRPVFTTDPHQPPIPPAKPTGGYAPFRPSFAPTQGIHPPQRSFTGPPEVLRRPALPTGPQRSATAPPEQGSYDYILEEYRGDVYDGGNSDAPIRSASTAPRYAQHDSRRGW